MPQTPPVSTAALQPGRRRILASYSQDAEQASAWLREILHTFARSAADALEQAGAEVVFVDAGRSADDPVALVASFDGVLVLGGGDLDKAAHRMLAPGGDDEVVGGFLLEHHPLHANVVFSVAPIAEGIHVAEE